MRPPPIVSVGAGVYRRASLRAPVTTRARRWLLALLIPLAALSAFASLERRAPDRRRAPRAVRPAVPLPTAEPPPTPLTDVVSLAAGAGGAWIAVTRDGSRYGWSPDVPDPPLPGSYRRRAHRIDAGAPSTMARPNVNLSCGHAWGHESAFILVTRWGLKELHMSVGDRLFRADGPPRTADERVVDLDTAGDLWIDRTAAGTIHVRSACEPHESHYANLAQAPSPVARFADAASVAAGGQFVCVNSHAGAVHCWVFYRAPLESVNDVRDYVHHRTGPVRLPVPPVSRIALDHDRGCGIARDASVWCWSVAALSPPRWSVWRHPWLRGATTLHLPGDRLCATLDDRRVLCDRRWRLPPDPSERPDASELTGLPGAVQILGGCARLDDGTVRCWGDGPLPDGRLMASRSPVRADVPEALLSLASGEVHTCGLGRSGRVWCWGTHAASDYTPLPAAPVAGITDAAQVAIGATHACARLRGGGVSCWGTNPTGECAQPRGSGAPVPPTRVADLEHVVEISAGDGHSCARLADGTVRCWGAFGTAWPGHPRVHGAVRPLSVALPFAATALVSAGGYACARASDGHYACWGGGQGARSDGETDARATFDVDLGAGGALVPSGTAALDCARDDRGRVRCDARFDDRSGDFTVTRDDGEVIGDGVGAVARGAWHACRARGGEVSCVRVGTAARNDERGLPGDVHLPRPPRAFTAGHSFSCALTDDGAAWCWGANALGRLGTGAPGVVTIDAPALVVR